MEQLKEQVVVSVKETLSTISKGELYHVEEVKWRSVMIVLRKQDGPLKEVNLEQERLVKVLQREKVARPVEDLKDVRQRDLPAVEDVPPPVDHGQDPVPLDVVVVKHI